MTTITNQEAFNRTAHRMFTPRPSPATGRRAARPSLKHLLWVAYRPITFPKHRTDTQA